MSRNADKVSISVVNQAPPWPSGGRHRHCCDETYFPSPLAADSNHDKIFRFINSSQIFCRRTRQGCPPLGDPFRSYIFFLPQKAPVFSSRLSTVARTTHRSTAPCSPQRMYNFISLYNSYLEYFVGRKKKLNEIREGKN